MKSKREPPAGPQIQRREEPAPSTAPAQRNTIEVEADWLIEDAPRVEIEAAKETGALKSAPLPSAAVPRGKLAPIIPREDDDGDRPPPRRRSKPPSR